MTDLSDVNEDRPPSSGDNGRSGGKENAFLGVHLDRFAKALADMERQRWWLRGIVLGVALIAVVAAGWLECRLIEHILDSQPIPHELFFILAVSPIAAITVIVVFMLIGVFRGYSEKDMEKLPSGVLSGASGMNGG